MVNIIGNIFIGSNVYGDPFGNDSLTSLTGLGEEVTISGTLSIKRSYALTNLTGLESLTSVGNETVTKKIIKLK